MTSMTCTTPVVRLAGVDKVFPIKTEADTVALPHIDLDVQQGEFISLLGPSGCGKCTLLRVIGDLVTPTAGTGRGERQDRPPGPSRP